MLGRYLTPRVRFDLHGEYYSETLLEEESFELNTTGFTLGYRVPESQRWNRHRLNQLVLGVEAQHAERELAQQDPAAMGERAVALAEQAPHLPGVARIRHGRDHNPSPGPSA